MTNEQFCKHYPYLYHMAEAGTWESIKKLGLLSTLALTELFEITGAEKRKLVSERRPEMVRICHKKYGIVTIRDNKPITDSKLLNWLIDMSPREWYETLSRRVFFWTNKERLDSLLNARAYRQYTHTVITVETALLLERNNERITLSPINSGAMPFGGSPRGVGTFCTLAQWPDAEGPRSGKLRKPVVELAVEHFISNMQDIAIRVDEIKEKRLVKKIWARA